METVGLLVQKHVITALRLYPQDILLISTLEIRSMMAWGIAGTEDIGTTESRPVECDNEVLGIAEFTLGEAIYFSEAVPPTTPTP
jgi:hypothetical protein